MMSAGSIMRLAALILILLFAPGLAAAVELRGGEASLASLQAEVTRLAARAGGTMGVGILHLETGASVYLNGGQSFPMASTYKIAMAVTLLQDVEAGRNSLTKRVEIRPEDLVVSSTLTARLRYANSAVSVRNLLEIMLVISDNTATDLIFDEAGGGAEITARMRALGINGMRVDRNTADLIRDYLGWDNPPMGEKISLADQIDALSDEDREGVDPGRELLDAFNADPRDNSTPEAMTALLAKIWRGEALGPEGTTLLKEIMERCETGNARLKGLLPEDTIIAHKTGTIGETTNDVGVITLPHGRGTLIVTAFVKASTKPGPERERAIAEVARAAHDFFVFNIVD